ncbi:hypothetical protein ATEIFO6365_0001067200 [Aspergillus terreus]|uniref:Uncharacterized protein n=1 Tax=Aspergillus terreus TaxID=33178 RepID=A0A5M3YQ59_ASPTE|nr:hypothetical protein ATETN484_0001059300 [Aspergillus terreus]GFF12449.1 hypothetical protein ATEIFO6365_0001067200 [Aspergillus terreus]
MQLLKLGALAALAQTISAAHIYIKTTSPPANKYVSHCTVIIDDELFGCSGSSEPFSKGCGGNRGTSTKSICKTAQVTVDWDNGKLDFTNDSGDHANCTLSTTQQWGECDTTDPNKYPKVEDNGAASSLFGAGSAIAGLGSLAAGLMI